MVFDSWRAAFRGGPDGHGPLDRRATASAMREALVAARVGLDDLRRGVAEAQERTAAACRELETIERRGRLAGQVGDTETVAIAARFAMTQAERVAVLQAKADVQARELAMAEREVAEMTAELRRVAATGQATAAGASPSETTGDMARASDDAAAGDTTGDAQHTTDRPDPDALLAALKRRMGR